MTDHAKEATRRLLVLRFVGVRDHYYVESVIREAIDAETAEFKAKLAEARKAALLEAREAVGEAHGQCRLPVGTDRTMLDHVGVGHRGGLWEAGRLIDKLIEAEQPEEETP